VCVAGTAFTDSVSILGEGVSSNCVVVDTVFAPLRFN